MRDLNRIQGVSRIPGDPPHRIQRVLSGGGGGAGYVLPPATADRLGGIIVGEDLQITAEGILSVVKANAMEQDNTHPITAAAVYTEVGNINALLHTI